MMEVCVQGVHEQAARVHKLSFRPVQPGDGPVHRSLKRMLEVT